MNEVRKAADKLCSKCKHMKVEAMYEEIKEVVLEFLRLPCEQGETVTLPILHQLVEEASALGL